MVPKLQEALEAVNPGRSAPWSVLADNESFLCAPQAERAHRAIRVRLWKIPPSSPDLNPVEKMWAWVRKQIIRMDLQDLRIGKPAVSRQGLKQRLQRLLAIRKAQATTRTIALGLRKVRREVSTSGGGPSNS